MLGLGLPVTIPSPIGFLSTALFSFSNRFWKSSPGATIRRSDLLSYRAFRVGLDLLDPLERSSAVYSFILRHPWVKPKIGTIKKATGFYRAFSS